MAKTENKNIRVKLRDVRLSYPALFEKKQFEDNEPRYQAAFIMDPSTKAGKANIAALQDAIDEVSSGKKVKNCYAMKEGDEDKEETEGMMVCGSSNKGRPTVLDRDKTPLTADDGKPYGGCYVNAHVDVYWLEKYRAVCATLMGVQFVRDGEAFGASPASAEDFDDLDDEPAPKKKKKPVVEDDDDDEPAPKKKKKPVVEDDDDDEPAPKKKKKPVVEDDDDDEPAPKKKKKPVVEDDDDDI